MPGLFEKAEGLYPAAMAVGNGQARRRKSGLVGQQANQLGVGAAFLRRTRQPDAKLQIAVRPPQRTKPDAGRTGRHHDSDGPSAQEQFRELLIIRRLRVQDCQTASTVEQPALNSGLRIPSPQTGSGDCARKVLQPSPPRGGQRRPHLAGGDSDRIAVAVQFGKDRGGGLSAVPIVREANDGGTTGDVPLRGRALQGRSKAASSALPFSTWASAYRSMLSSNSMPCHSVSESRSGNTGVRPSRGPDPRPGLHPCNRNHGIRRSHRLRAGGDRFVGPAGVPARQESGA